ncbi:SLATT domain-containing protein [Promicromonospora sp. CA-289599]|uniref:SLATT domain-containing protein n=1 Tax=Promicromonospora sp. CA-289599 TaxID=3240014 RepID=UPI003D8C7ADA
MATPNDEVRCELRDELDRLEERATWSSQGQFEQAKSWRALNVWLGAPVAAMAAVSGALVLASNELNLLGGGLALAAAAGGAVLTAVNPSTRADRASAAANAYLEIQTAARQLRLIDLPTRDTTDARQDLSELTARMEEQNKAADPISRRAYRRAGKNIKGGGQKYTADRRNEGIKNGGA